MKKFILVAAAIAITATPVLAQKAQVKEAISLLNDRKLEEARTAIETAVNNEATKGDPRAWYVRGTVYLALQETDQGQAYYKEAYNSLKKVIALDPAYEKADVNMKLFAVAIYHFNAGIGAFNSSKHEQAFDNFNEVQNIYNLEGGKRFTGADQMALDTIVRQAALQQGYSAYYAKNYDAAMPLLEKAKNDPVVKSDNTYNVYLMLADIYEMKADDARAVSTYTEGKKAYPGEKSLVNAELNYYIKKGRSEELTGKLEEALKSDPNNADLLYVLAMTYDKTAYPKDNKGANLARPANFDDLFTKAETAYKGSIAAKAGHPESTYNLGALYFNRAVLINDDMNAAIDQKPRDDKKIEKLQGERNNWFVKALPYLEQTIAMYDGKAASLAGEDKQTYVNALTSAKIIYANQSKGDKADAMKKKLDGIK